MSLLRFPASLFRLRLAWLPVCVAAALLVAVGLGVATLIATTLAAEPAVPTGVVALTATASVEVTRDLMAVTLTATREGSDAHAVQAALKQALDGALAEAKSVAKPG